MNSQKIPTQNQNNSKIRYNLNKYIFAIQTRYQTHAARFVNERKQKSNKLLFGITVAALTGIMGGAIFLAMNPPQPQKASTNSITHLADNQSTKN